MPKHIHHHYAPSVTSTHMTHIISSTAPSVAPGFVDRPHRSDCTAGQMDGEAGWWTTSGNIGLPPLARVMGVGRQQHYSRRDNLIIIGVTEESNEDMSTCKRLVRNIFIQKLNLSEIEVNTTNFVRCHTIGKTTLLNGTVNRKRPIIVRFHPYNVWKAVWPARSALNNESISINESFAAEV